MPCVKHAGAPLENATFDEENMESISEFAEQIISCGAHRIVLSGPRGEKRARKNNLHQRFFCLFGLCQNHPITIVPFVNMVWMGFCVGEHGFRQPLPQECLQLLYFMQLHACTQV